MTAVTPRPGARSKAGPAPLTDQEQADAQRLGEVIRLRRRHAGLTQADLSRRAQIGERHLRNLELGRRRTRRSTLHELAEVLVIGNGVRAGRVQPLPPLATDATTSRLQYI